MKKAVSVFAFLLSLPLALVAQQNASALLKDYTRSLSVTNGLNLSLVHINDHTVGVLFQPPTVYAIRARARESTELYVQGLTSRDVEIDTNEFTLEQDGEKSPGAPTNV